MIDTLESLLRDYGYIAIIIGTFIEGETVLVLGGLAAANGYLSLPLVYASAVCGSLAGDQAFFFIGRIFGVRLLERWPSWKPRVAKTFDRLERWRNWLIVTFRFYYGIQYPVAFALGMSPVKTRTFVLLNMLGVAIWAGVYGMGGYFGGRAFLFLIGDVRLFFFVLIAAAIIVGAVVWWIYRRRRMRARAAPPAVENDRIGK
jgi:membrane protein DedA with SNARE-associated domain